MSRRSEIVQMDIQREFCSTMQELREIWDEIGIPDEQIDSRGNTVIMHVRNLLSEMVSEEQNLKKNMLEKIDGYVVEVDELTTKLGLPSYEPSSGLTIMQREKDWRMQANRLNKLKRERMCTLASLKSVEQELCDQLCTTPCYIPSGSIPSEEQLEQLKDHIETLKTEKDRRKEVFTTKKAEIVCMYDELDLLPESSFAQDLVTEELDSFALSTGKLDELEDLRSGLARQKSDAEKLMEKLWTKVNSLWERLEVPDSERAEVKSECQGIKPVHIKALKLVLEKLEAAKLASLQRLTERARSEIAILWDKCFYSAEQRTEFTAATDENYTELLLEMHEEELVKMHAYYEEHQEMFVNVNKWQLMFHRMLELEAKAHDVNRFSNRGGNLLQEEKERKRIHKQLPKIEEDLFAAIEVWEEKKGQPFLVEGIRFADYVHSQWEACERRKESEKQLRHEKKQQEMHSEMTYGSAPKTPTKRRFIGTTTILKTPTSSAKKPKRGPMDSTWRSTATIVTPGNRTAATYASPGKPPISSRLRTPCGQPQKPRTPAAKRALVEKNRKAPPSTKSGPGSTKSAPATVDKADLDTTFIKGLSTTVVSSNTGGSTESVKSMPIPEVRGTHYSDFAAAINSNAKENRAVRSSAIGDYART
uniref:Protein regulator of cytokinesis 1 n=1 Tax=Phallusia mammillata TaxID=59560 RepID=A0A6F9DQ20_9ASCI|nr:protein regulator of cytokinesis 1 [Phallusia mammillata]